MQRDINSVVAIESKVIRMVDPAKKYTRLSSIKLLSVLVHLPGGHEPVENREEPSS